MSSPKNTILPRKPVPLQRPSSRTSYLGVQQDDSHIELDTLITPTENYDNSYRAQHDSQTSQKFVKWGVQWQRPTLMLAFALSGILLALGHHFYYNRLNGTLAGSDTRQQWAHAFGNAFSFIVVVVLRAANSAAYNQYSWMLVRQRGFTVESLDKLFALNYDLTGFFSLELLRRGKFVVLLALICWLTTFAGIVPPGTLAVVPGFLNQSNEASWISLNWNSTAWTEDTFNVIPSSLVLDIAAQTAEGMTIVPLTAPELNSSYALQFYGPYIQCEVSNSSQAPVLEYYVDALAEAFIYIEDTWESQKSKTYNQTVAPVMMVASIFDPFLGLGGWLNYTEGYDVGDPGNNIGLGTPDTFNNWPVNLPFDFLKNSGFPDPEINSTMVSHQLWVQTANESLVCTLGNASFNIGFEFVDGAQTITQGSIGDFQPLFVPRSPPPYSSIVSTKDIAYMSVYVAISNMLSGNVSTELLPNTTGINGLNISRVAFFDTSSRILLTGLSACDDFVDNFWTHNPIYWDYDDNLEGPISKWPGAFIDNHFEKPSWMCRNRTLMRAIEDLATNITISMLSSSILTSPNSTTINVLSFNSHNIYQYNSRNLIISYGIAILFAAFGVGLGLYSIKTNGVYHSSFFSAHMATTRNSELDILSEGHSLGAFPLDTNMSRAKLRFGEVMRNPGLMDSASSHDMPGHVAFGFEDKVLRLRKGGHYT